MSDPLLALDQELSRILSQPRPEYERIVTELREQFGGSVDIIVAFERTVNKLRAELIVNDRDGKDTVYFEGVAARASSLEQYCQVSLSWASEWSVH